MRRLLPVLALALVTAGCGGATGTASKTGTRDEAAKPPRQILADAAAALRRVHSYHIEGTETDNGGVTTLSGDVGPGGRVQVSTRNGDVRADVRIVGPGETYLRASRAFWLAHAPRSSARPQALAALLADRWIRPPATATADLDQIARQSRPAATAHCLFHGIGTLGNGGTVTIGGRRAVIVTSKADRPGAAPGAVYVALAAPHLPLRTIQSGPQRPGGTFDPLCDSHGDTTRQADVRLSRFDEPVRIAAPPSSLDLTAAGQAGSAL